MFLKTDGIPTFDIDTSSSEFSSMLLQFTLIFYNIVVQKDIPESISPVRELRRSPRKHKPFVTPEKSATAPRLGSGGFLFTVRSVSSLEGIASPVGSKGERGGNISSSVPVDHG